MAPGAAPDDRARGPALARWGWLVTTVAMGAALIVSSWANYRSAVDASTRLDRSQGYVLRGSVSQFVKDLDGPVDDRTLAAVLDDQAESGLRYAAVYDERGRRVAVAGTPSASPAPVSIARGTPAGAETDPTLVDLGDRVRMTFNPPPRKDGTDAASDPGRPAYLLEFEPLVSHELQTRAARSFGLGVAAAIVLMIAALVFWRMTQRYETVRRELEHQRRLGLLGEMSAVLAHEIRNPLASLKGNAQLLAERARSGSTERKKADRVVREAERLERMTTNLLDFVRSGSIERKRVDPRTLLAEAADLVDGPGFSVIDEGAPETWPLDEDRIRQALVNVLRNAAEASANGQKAEACVSTDGENLVFTIRDRGDGLPAKDPDAIFEPFFTTRSRGAGLGLAVTRRIVQLHGGTVRAANRSGGGAVFRLSIPG